MQNFEHFQLAQNYSENELIPEDIISGKEAWEDLVKGMKTSPEKVAANTAEMHKSYFSLVLFIAHYNHYMQTSFIYDHYTWDVLAMMLFGIALYKMRIITAERAYKTYILMAICGYAVGISINYYELMLILNDDFSVNSFIKSSLTYPLGRIAVTIGHVGVIMIFCKLQIFSFIRKSLAAVGRMALTNYVMHSVICAFVFTGIGFSLFGQLERFELYYVVFAIWIFQMIASPIWLKYYKFGPLEWLWRSLTYKKKQRMKRDVY